MARTSLRPPRTNLGSPSLLSRWVLGSSVGLTLHAREHTGLLNPAVRTALPPAAARPGSQRTAGCSQFPSPQPDSSSFNFVKYIFGKCMKSVTDRQMPARLKSPRRPLTLPQHLQRPLPLRKRLQPPQARLLTLLQEAGPSASREAELRAPPLFQKPCKCPSPRTYLPEQQAISCFLVTFLTELQALRGPQHPT